MKGYIEIYTEGESGKKLIFSEENMILDGAREHVAKMLSFHGSPSALTALAGYDLSNHDIKAITLGPPEESFRHRDTRYYPGTLASTTFTSSVYNISEIPLNGQFSEYTHNQLRYDAAKDDLGNLWAPNDWGASLDGGWVASVVGSPSRYFTEATNSLGQAGVTTESNALGESVTYVTNVGHLPPNTHFKLVIDANSVGPDTGWVEGNDPIEVRVFKAPPNLPGDLPTSSVAYYDFTRDIFDGPLSKGAIVSLAKERSLHEVSFQTEGTDIDEIYQGTELDEYVIEILVPGRPIDDKFSKITIWGTVLWNHDKLMLANSDFKQRGTDLINSDFRRRSVPTILQSTGQRHAANILGLRSFDGWWNVGGSMDEVPLFSSTDVFSEYETKGSARYITSSLKFLDEPAEGFVSLRSGATGFPRLTDGSSCFLPTRFHIDRNMISDGTEGWSETVDDLDKKAVFNLSFWYYSPSANPGNLGVYLRTIGSPNNGDHYAFRRDTTNDIEFYPKRWYSETQTPITASIARSEQLALTQGEWKYYSRDITFTLDQIQNDQDFILYFRLDKTTAGEKFTEAYLKDIRLGQIPGYYGNANASSTIQYASGGGIDLNFYDDPNIGAGEGIGLNHLTTRVTHMHEQKSYTPVITYSSPSATNLDMLKLSLFTKHDSGAGGAAGDLEKSMFYQWSDASGVWASSLQETDKGSAYITLGGTAGVTVTSSLPPIWGLQTLQRETVPRHDVNVWDFPGFPNQNIYGSFGGDNPPGYYSWFFWQGDLANNTCSAILQGDGPPGHDRCVSITTDADNSCALASIGRTNFDGTPVNSSKFYKLRFWARVDDDSSNPVIKIEGARWPGAPNHNATRGSTALPYNTSYHVYPSTTWAQYEVEFWGDPRRHDMDVAGFMYEGGKFTFLIDSSVAANNNRDFRITQVEFFEAEGATFGDIPARLEGREVLLRIEKPEGQNTSATITDFRLVDSDLIAQTNHLVLDKHLESQETSLPGETTREMAWRHDKGFLFTPDQLNPHRHMKLNASGSDYWLEVHHPYKDSGHNASLSYQIDDIHRDGFKVGDEIAWSFDHSETDGISADRSWDMNLHTKEHRVDGNNQTHWTYHTWNFDTGEWDDGISWSQTNYAVMAASSLGWTNFCSDQYDSNRGRTPRKPKITSLFDKGKHGDLRRVALRLAMKPRQKWVDGAVHRMKEFRVYNTSDYTDTTGLMPVIPNPIDTTLQPSSTGPGRLGHFLNYLEFSSTPDSSAMTLAELVQHGSYLPGNNKMHFASGTFGAGPADLTNSFSGTLSGVLNGYSVVNSDGFILENTTARATHSISDSSAGFVVSGVSGVDGGDHREVKYILTLLPNDWKFLDYYYGGIGSIGLWTIDYQASIKKILGEGGYPPLWNLIPGTPYATSLYNLTDTTKNPVFKLFAKKVFFPGGLKIPENTDYSNHLTIIWGIKF